MPPEDSRPDPDQPVGELRIALEPKPDAEWDAFVESQPNATLGHAAAWSRILEAAYGLDTRYWVARAPATEAGVAGELRGVLPLVRFKRPFGPAHWISLPFLDSAGVLAADRETESALIEAALDQIRRDGAEDLELRNSVPIPGYAPPQDLDRVNLVMDLAEDEETQWTKLRAKVRNQTRKATKEGLELMEGSNAELLAGFFAPFEVNMRDLGSPVHSRRFFEAAQAEFGDRLRFIVTHSQGVPVGGLVAIRFADRVTVPWASTLRSERARCPNNLIYWEALRWAIEQGARRFDFGRSPQGSGTHRFKVGWGAEEQPLPWLRLAPNGEIRPIVVGERSRAVQLLSEWWTRLPVPLATVVGSKLRPFFSN